MVFRTSIKKCIIWICQIRSASVKTQSRTLQNIWWLQAHQCMCAVQSYLMWELMSLNGCIEERVSKDLGTLRFWPQIQFKWSVSVWAPSPRNHDNSTSIPAFTSHASIYVIISQGLLYSIHFFFLLNQSWSILITKETNNILLAVEKEHSIQQHVTTSEHKGATLRFSSFSSVQLSTGICQWAKGLIIFSAAALISASLDFFRHRDEEKGWRSAGPDWGDLYTHSPTPEESDGWPSAWPLNEVSSYALDAVLVEKSSLCPGRSLSLLGTAKVRVRSELSMLETVRRHS